MQVPSPFAPPPDGLVTSAGVLVIVGGGRVDEASLRALARRGATLVAADGGADTLRAHGLVPEAIIGDFDSLSSDRGWPDSVRMIRIEEQLTTDFEKCLYCTRAPVTVALGMTGGRFDHTLAALDAVTRHAVGRPVILVDEHDIALAISGPFSFCVAPGERVSVHPLAPVRFAASEGLAYALDGLELAPGVRIGTSNVALTGAFRIEPVAGDIDVPWLLIVARTRLDALITRFLGALPAKVGTGFAVRKRDRKE